MNNKVGRPSQYKPEYCELLIDHMSEGLSFESFGGLPEVRVSKKTLYDWAEKNPEFLNAKELGTDACRLYWEQLGRDHILNVSENAAGIGGSSKSLNATVWRLNMGNRFGWRDKQPDEVPQINLSVGNMTDEELIQIVKDHTAKKDG